MKLFLDKMLCQIANINKLFLLSVVIPTALAIFYYGFYATDIFISESRFVLRTPQNQSQSGVFGALLQGTGFSRSQDDAYSVHDYIKSRDALSKLDKSLKLKNTYSKNTVDIINRFAGIDGDYSFEAFHKYYQKYVEIEYDTSSSITVLKTSAFNAKDAYLMNVELLDMSEKLVNQLNDRGRRDLVSYAKKEVDEAERKAKAATLAVSKFRSKETVVDPEKQSSQQLLAVGKLQEDLVTTNNQLAQLKSLAPENPQIPVLKVRIEYLQKAIESETAKVTGSGKSSLTNKVANYERLSLEREFADKNLAYALTALTTAKNEALRQQLYLERLVQPSLPDIAVEPRRLRSLLAVFVLGMMAWGMLTMLVAGIKEHKD
jgi:capsular polysaccharide transport system permease protein